MTQVLVIKPDQNPYAGFHWRDCKGKMHRIAEMETRHLFYTIKMIWNHACPVDLRVDANHLYRFKGFYTPNYMLTAFNVGWVELMDRTNLTPYMREKVRVIEENYRKYRAYVMPEIGEKQE